MRRLVRSSALALAALALGACDGPDAPTPAGGGGGAPIAAERARFDFPIETPRPGDPLAAAPRVAAAQQELRLGHAPEALAHLRAALELDPACLEALLLRGTIGLQKSFAYEPLQALAAFRAARLVDPQSLPARVGEASARLALEDDVGAAPLFVELAADDEAGRIAPSDDQRAIVRRGLAQIALRAGQFEAALLDAERALKLRPERTTLALRAEIFERMGRPDDARADLALALAQKGDDASLHFAAARIERKLGATELAERHLRAYQALLPFEEDASSAFKEDHARRVQLRRDFLAAWPEHRRARHLLIRELQAAREFAEAKRELEALVAAAPGDGEAWFLLAQVHHAQGDGAAARAAADRMLATGVAQPVYDDLLRQLAAKSDGAK